MIHVYLTSTKEFVELAQESGACIYALIQSIDRPPEPRRSTEEGKNAIDINVEYHLVTSDGWYVKNRFFGFQHPEFSKYMTVDIYHGNEEFALRGGNSVRVHGITRWTNELIDEKVVQAIKSNICNYVRPKDNPDHPVRIVTYFDLKKPGRR